MVRVLVRQPHWTGRHGPAAAEVEAVEEEIAHLEKVARKLGAVGKTNGYVAHARYHDGAELAAGADPLLSSSCSERPLNGTAINGRGETSAGSLLGPPLLWIGPLPSLRMRYFLRVASAPFLAEKRKRRPKAWRATGFDSASPLLLIRAHTWILRPGPTMKILEPG